MTTLPSKRHWDDDSRFDRLVDGALTQEDYKSFLSALDDEPSGWRRCALAFLEAQAWSKEFAPIGRADEKLSPARERTAVAPKPQKASWPLPLIAAAASCLLAFCLGLGVQARLLTQAQQSLAAAPAAAVPGVGQKVESPPSAVDRSEPGYGEMRLVVNRGNGLPPEEIIVPVRESSGPESETLVETTPAISDSLLRALELRGHKVSREQEFVPLLLSDGREVIFPVEQYHITPVSRKSY